MFSISRSFIVLTIIHNIMEKSIKIFLYICLSFFVISCVSNKDKHVEKIPDTEENTEEKHLGRKEIFQLVEQIITEVAEDAAQEGLTPKKESVPEEKQKTETANAITKSLKKMKNTQQIADFIEKNYSEKFEIPYETFSASLDLPDSNLLPFGALVFESYRLAYPYKNMKVYEKDGDWCIELEDMIFAWADGRILPFKKRVEASQYGKQMIYPNFGKPRNPKEYTPEDLIELRKKGTKDYLAEEKPVDLSFTQFLFQTNDRIETERNIRSMTFLGHRLNIHKMVLPFFEKIDNEIRALAKTDKEIASFIANISEIGGYNWRVIDGTAGRRSYHSYGMAVDILVKNNKKPIYWEWVRTWNSKWMLLPQSSLWLPPESVIKIFEKYGFVWGGTWDEYDTMHFEYRPELAILAYLSIVDEE